MAIKNSDGSIIITTDIDISGIVKASSDIKKHFSSYKDQKRYIDAVTDAIEQQQNKLEALIVNYAKLVADGDAYTKEARELKEEIKQETAAMKELQNASKILGAGKDELKQKTAALVEETVSSFNNTKKHFSSYKEQKAYIESVTEAINKQQIVLDALNVKYAKFVAEGKAHTQEAEGLKEKIKEETAAMKELQDASKTLGADTDKLKQKTADLGTKTVSTFDKMKSAVKRYVSYFIGIQTLFSAIRFSGEAASLASQTESGVSRLIDIYGEASNAVGEFIDQNTKALGLSKAAAASYAATYGNIFSSFADQKANAELTNEFLNLTAVVASKTGRTIEEVQEKIQSGLFGNLKAIDDLGIYVRQSAVESTKAFEEIANGRAWEQLTSEEQQQIRAFAILEQGVQKYGNQVMETTALTRSRFSAAYEDFKNTWGRFINTILMPILEVLTEIFDAATQVMNKLSGQTGGMLESYNGKDIISAQTSEIGKSTQAQKGFTNAVKETNKELNKTLFGWDEVTKLQSASTVSVGGGGDLTVSSPTANKNTAQASKEYKKLGGVFDWLKSKLEPLNKISFNKLSESLKNLKSKLDPFKNMALNTLDWLWNEIVVPMGKWTIEKAVPTFLDLLSAAAETLGIILETAKPYIQWIWEEIIKPMGEFVGDLFIEFLGLLTEGFTNFSNWAINNKDAVEIMFDVFLSALSGIWAYNTTKKLIDFLSKLKKSFEELGGMQGIFDKIKKGFNSVAGALGAVTTAVMFWVMNWDDLANTFKQFGKLEKLISLLYLAAAAWAVYWTAQTAGVAAATIVASLALLGFGAGVLAYGNSKGYTSGGEGVQLPPEQAQAYASIEPSGYAKGTVVPPNRPHLAWFGDNTKEPEVVSPISTMKQAFTEAYAEMGGNNQQIHVTIQLDRDVLYRSIIEANEENTRRTGENAFA